MRIVDPVAREAFLNGLTRNVKRNAGTYAFLTMSAFLTIFVIVVVTLAPNKDPQMVLPGTTVKCPTLFVCGVSESGHGFCYCSR